MDRILLETGRLENIGGVGISIARMRRMEVPMEPRAGNTAKRGGLFRKIKSLAIVLVLAVFLSATSGCGTINSMTGLSTGKDPATARSMKTGGNLLLGGIIFSVFLDMIDDLILMAFFDWRAGE
jgi:uncharacterized protein YceK